MAEKRKLITIVTPTYNESLNVEDCRRAIVELFEKRLPEYDHEQIFCDNASADDTVAILRKMAAADPRVKVIVNARNFGPFRSTFNGLLATTGDAVVPLFAADLQDPAEVIVEFVRQWEAGHEIVYGIRANREEGALMRGVRHAYYRTVQRITDIHIPPDVAEFQLIDKVVVDALRKFDDYYPYIRGMIASCGFRSVGVPYTWKARKKGLSKNRLYDLIDQAINGLISFSNVPLRLALFFGLILSGLSILYAIFTAAVNLIFYRKLAPAGIPTLLTALFFFSGVQLFFLGVFGEYISAIQSQVRKRPLVIERERINFPDDAKPPA
jgi:glycosyltransferase involved in cell wall biosynthesis